MLEFSVGPLQSADSGLVGGHGAKFAAMATTEALIWYCRGRPPAETNETEHAHRNRALHCMTVQLDMHWHVVGLHA